MSKPVTIIMIEDDEGHARLIERNIRRSGVNNDIIPFTNGTDAVNYLFGKDSIGPRPQGRGAVDPARSQPARHDRHRDLAPGQGEQISQMRAGRGADHDGRFPEIKRCYELGCNVYITKPVNYESFANAIRQLGLFFSVIQVPPAAT